VGAVTLTCPHCGAEIEVEVAAPKPLSGRNWRRLALLALAVVLIVMTCIVVECWVR